MNVSQQNRAAVMDAAQAVASLGPQEVELLKNGSHTGVAYRYPNGTYVYRLKPKRKGAKLLQDGGYGYADQQQNSGKGSTKGFKFRHERNNSPQSVFHSEQLFESCSSSYDDNKQVPLANSYKNKSSDYKKSSQVKSSQGSSRYSKDPYEQQSGVYDYNPYYQNLAFDKDFFQNQQQLQKQQQFLTKKSFPEETFQQKPQQQAQFSRVKKGMVEEKQRRLESQMTPSQHSQKPRSKDSYKQKESKKRSILVSNDIYAVEELWNQPTVILKPWY